jgi:hypothetical protein
MYQKNPLFGYLCINKINCLTDTHKKTTKMTTGIIVAMEKELRLLTPSLYMPQITEEKGFTLLRHYRRPQGVHNEVRHWQSKCRGWHRCND